ncbi:pol-like protein [Apostichopus japonicus]|uniref:Pol-like protein n=1 Tax=Stichopus japonicus TaxID=307972 RepID=A0A2G8L4N1_STIJA|nr:pol-like protein [Apostichopus japonicus]
MKTNVLSALITRNCSFNLLTVWCQSNPADDQLPESFHVEKGLWRLNTEIVKEQNFKEQFVEKYRGWQSLKPAFSNALVWWDEVKSLIKQFAIRYCVERAHQRRFKFHSLCNRARDGSSSDLHALGVFLDEKLHGARVRARIHFVEADEKPTIRFYRDDTKSVVDRRIRAVCHPGGVVVESPQAVLGVFGSFFSNLYSRAAVSEDLQEDLLSGIDKAPLRVKMIAWAPISPLSGDPLDPRNRRPITLLNVDYKILAKALGNRLSDVMPDIVGPLQTCAVRGKCIQHNLWLMRDLIEFVKVRDLPCALVSLDQEKAFDMRSPSGLSLSPLLYVLFSETLSTSLDRCFGFRPFNVPGGARVKCVQYADDVTCIVSDLASFKPLSKVLTTFQEATGARLNKSKTKGLRLGGWRGQSLPFDATWSDVMIKVNGIWLGYGAPEATTWAEKADQVEARLDTFSHRWLSLPGKVTVVNRFIVPLLWYPGTVIAAPDHALVRLERIIFDFIWGKRKPNLVKRTVLYKTPLSGGLGLVHLPSKLRFLLLKGVFVAFENPSFPFAFFVRYWGGFLFRHHGPDPFPITGQRRHALLGSILRLVTLFVESKKRVGHMFC